MTRESKPKILVAIASYGTNNDRYLAQLVHEYQSMSSFDVHIVVLCNVRKDAGPGVELVVGLPMKNPWTLPFPHKQIFADRLNEYDLFIYSEDDTLITEKNIMAFLKVTEILPDNIIAGFLRFEGIGGIPINFPEVHAHFHWEPESVRAIGEYRFAHFTNEHSACYVMTREQLCRAIHSGGFLVGPHEGKYDLLCTVATDPYTQCGFRKLLCISHLDDFLVHHLPNKYVGTVSGVTHSELRRQVDVLLQIGQNGHRPATLFQTESKLKGGLYSKDYYEMVRPEIALALPGNVRNVLSVGCGWGAMEAHLATKGFHVVAVPVDPVIPGGAEAAGVEIIRGDFQTARKKLEGRSFDCLLLSNVLHLVAEPSQVLALFTDLLTPGAITIIVVPNLVRLKASYDLAKKAASYAHESLPTYSKRMFGDKTLKDLGDYQVTGIRGTSYRALRGWCKVAGLRLERTTHVLPQRAMTTSRLTLGLVDYILGSEIIAIAKRS
jgi:2-polyprenyl-3-methyl-5-hydroxy-6-metoxy-1,4-benzoquinol methylase